MTVTEFGQDYFDVNLANETLSRTNLGKLASYRPELELSVAISANKQEHSERGIW